MTDSLQPAENTRFSIAKVDKVEENDEVDQFIDKQYKSAVIVAKRKCRKYVGLFCAVVTGFLISVSVLAVKMLQNYHPLTVSLWRYTGNIPLVIALLLFCSIDKRKKVCQDIWPEEGVDKYQWMASAILLGNGILAWTSVNLRFYSLQFLTLTDATVISYSSPAFVVIFAHICLQEKCGVVSILLSLMAIGGVTTIARPPLLTGESEFDSQIMIGTILAVSSMIAHTSICILIRKSRKVHFSLVIFVHGICGFVLSFMASGSIWVFQFPEGNRDLIYAIIVVLSGFGTQVMLTLAFKFEEAAPVSLILSFQVVLTFLWQYIFLETSPDPYSLIGSAIIVTAVSLAIIRKWLLSLSEANLVRKRCWILLN